MLWIVLPLASLFVVVPFIVIVLVVIVYVVVVHVHVDIAVAPSAIPTPAPAPGGSQRDTGAERHGRSRRIISWGRIVNRGIGIDRRTINHNWIVRRDVNNLRVRLLYYDNLFTSLHCL